MFKKSHVHYAHPGAIDIAILRNDMRLLQWIENAGTHEEPPNNPFSYTHTSVRCAVRGNNPQILDWFASCGYPFTDCNALINLATGENCVDALRWFKSRGTNYRNSHISGDAIVVRGHLEMLDFHWSEGSRIIYTYRAIDIAAQNNRVDILQWFNRARYVQYSVDAIDKAATRGHLEVLCWFEQSGLPLICSYRALLGATRNNHLEVVQWLGAREGVLRLQTDSESRELKDSCINYSLVNLVAHS